MSPDKPTVSDISRARHGIALKRHATGCAIRSCDIKETAVDKLAAIQEMLAPLFPGLMGMKLSEVGPDRIVATLTVRPDLCTAGGILHGGALMAFADTLGAVGTFINLPDGKRTATIESSTKFIGAALSGSTVTGECIAFHRGKTTMVWQTTVKSEEGKLCGVVTQTQLVMPA
jgi:1,4-dihydroxy-2-naphthoyl-CoA hydrolase